MSRCVRVLRSNRVNQFRGGGPRAAASAARQAMCRWTTLLRYPTLNHAPASTRDREPRTLTAASLRLLLADLGAAGLGGAVVHLFLDFRSHHQERRVDEGARLRRRLEEVDAELVGVPAERRSNGETGGRRIAQRRIRIAQPRIAPSCCAAAAAYSLPFECDTWRSLASESPKSILLPTSSLLTLSRAYLSISVSQRFTFLKESMLVMSYTTMMPCAPR